MDKRNNTALSPTPHLKRLLIIDDEAGAFPHEDLFDHMLMKEGAPPVKVEWVLAKNIDEAIRQLERWKKEGHPADLISIDMHEGLEHPVGKMHSDLIKKWSQNNHLATPALFYHTGGDLKGGDQPLDPDIKPYSIQEIREAVKAFNHEDFPLDAFQNVIKPARLIPYLNDNWGTAYPENQQELLECRKRFGVVTANEGIKKTLTGLLTERDVIRKVDLDSISMYPQLDATRFQRNAAEFARQVAGDVSGNLAFNPEQARALGNLGLPVILVIEDYNQKIVSSWLREIPQIKGLVMLGEGSQHDMYLYEARGLPALSYCRNADLKITGSGDNAALVGKVANRAFRIAYGQPASLSDKKLYPTRLAKKKETLTEDEEEIAKWADRVCRFGGGLSVYANVDTGKEAQNAIENGAQGIGLVRTEHILHQDEETAQAFRRLLKLDPALPDNNDALEECYYKFYEAQTKGLIPIFEAANAGGRSFPVTVRLLDAPPGEFFDKETKDKDVAELQRRLGGDQRDMRGARFALKYEGLYQQQAEAIFNSAVEANFEGQLKIMVPLIYNAKELETIKQQVEAAAKASGFTGQYKFGAMIETLEAVDNEKEIKKIANLCEFVSFGSNDLTEATIGCARNDSEKTLDYMRATGNLVDNPFQTLVKPVLEKMRFFVKTAKAANPKLEIGICGDQVKGNPASILACHEMGLNSISLVPNKGPLLVSRILAGKAALAMKREIGEEDERYPSIHRTILPVERNHARDRFADLVMGTRWHKTNVGKECMTIIDQELDKCMSLSAIENYCNVVAESQEKDSDNHYRYHNPMLDYLLKTYCNILRQEMKLEVPDAEETPWIARAMQRDSTTRGTR